MGRQYRERDYLVEFTVVATNQLAEYGIRVLENPLAATVPKSRVLATGIVIIPKREIVVGSIGLIYRFVLLGTECCGCIEIIFESDEIAHPGP
jgi:hypothetical protein